MRNNKTKSLMRHSREVFNENGRRAVCHWHSMSLLPGLQRLRRIVFKNAHKDNQAVKIQTERECVSPVSGNEYFLSYYSILCRPWWIVQSEATISRGIPHLNSVRAKQAEWSHSVHDRPDFPRGR